MRPVRIINTLIQKDPARRFRDAHHLLEEFKKLQRRIAPVAPWEIGGKEAGSGPPRAAAAAAAIGGLNDLATWALKATIFGRMVATAYPGGGGPPKVMEAVENIWRMAAATTRLDGELQAEAKRNENLERRGREFAAQVGRRIEDLSREHSRLKREIAAASVDLSRLSDDYHLANEELVKAREIIATIDKGRDEMTDGLRPAYEMAGAAAARRQGRAEAVAKVEAKINKWQEDCSRIEAQLSEYREQLDRHSLSIEGDLEAGRQRLASKVQQRSKLADGLADSTTYLADHFRGKSECAPLYEELEELDRSSVVADVENPEAQPPFA